MMNGFDQADELPLIGRQLCMMWCHCPAEVGHNAIAMVQPRTEASARDIAIDDKTLGEVRKLQQRHRHERLLDLKEGRLCFINLGESLTLEEGCKRGSHTAIAGDELAVVACETKEAPQGPCRTWSWPRLYFYLVRVRGNPLGRNDMAKVGN